RARVTGDSAATYGYGTGTSYAAPQVAGAAALVWAANPSLTAAQVALLLERTAGAGHVLDVAAAVAAAQGKPAPAAAPAPPVVTLKPRLAAQTEPRVRIALVG